MTLSQALTPIAYLAVVLCWVSAAVLVRLTQRARVLGAPSVALRERAQAAVGWAVFTSLLAIALVNVDLGYPWLSVEGGRVLVRLAAILPAWIPARWLYRYWRGWL